FTVKYSHDPFWEDRERFKVRDVEETSQATIRIHEECSAAPTSMCRSSVVRTNFAKSVPPYTVGLEKVFDATKQLEIIARLSGKSRLFENAARQLQFDDESDTMRITKKRRSLEPRARTPTQSDFVFPAREHLDLSSSDTYPGCGCIGKTFRKRSRRSRCCARGYADAQFNSILNFEEEVESLEGRAHHLEAAIKAMLTNR
ncbi:hypothetical protein LTR16_005238, partial [Cryomyces antarcticus]